MDKRSKQASGLIGVKWKEFLCPQTFTLTSGVRDMVIGWSKERMEAQRELRDTAAAEQTEKPDTTKTCGSHVHGDSSSSS